MGRPYSHDLRARFVGALEDGMSASAAGRRMRISRSTAVRWAAIWYCEKRSCALAMGGDRRSGDLEAHADKIKGWLCDTPDLSLREIQSRLAELDVKTSISAIDRLLARHGLSFKKRPSLQKSKTAKMSRGPELIGGPCNPNCVPESSSSSTKVASM